MKLGELIKYGVFNTQDAFPGKKQTAERITDSYEIEYFISTTGKTVINGRTYEIAPGTLICAKPGQRRMSFLGFQCFFIHLTLPQDSSYRILLDSTPDFYQIIDRDKYGYLFETLIEHLLTDGYDPESELFNARLIELFYYLRQDAEQNRNCPALFDKSGNRFVLRTVEYIQENYPHKLTLETLSAITGYSPNYLHHVFTAVMGKTPQQYLTEVRLRAAKSLLVRTNKSLSDIAYECGFSSQSHFSQQFRRSTYVTPGAYRAHHLSSYRT